VNDFLIAQLAREHMTRLFREAELTRLVRGSATADARPMRRRRQGDTDHR
jgi:hypothetical protein